MLGRKVTHKGDNGLDCREGLVTAVEDTHVGKVYVVEYDNGQFGRYHSDHFKSLFTMHGTTKATPLRVVKGTKYPVYSFYMSFCRVWGSRSGRANQLAAHYRRRGAKLA